MILILAMIAGLALPTIAGPQRGSNYTGFETGRHMVHSGFRGGRGRFRGFHNRFRRGTFYGEIVILDDGCWFWNGFEWVVYVDCE